MEAIYDEQISPHMVEIIAVCKREGIPVVASFQFKNAWLCTTAIIPARDNDSAEESEMRERLREALSCLRGDELPLPVVKHLLSILPLAGVSMN